MKNEVFKFIGGAISFSCGGARGQSKFPPENSQFSYENYGKIILCSKNVIFEPK